MAFVDRDHLGENFVNVSMMVGPRRANFRDDVTLVQVLLILHFGSGGKAAGRLQHTSVDLGQIVLGTYDDNTGTLIKDFQRLFLRRPKPEGYIQRASGKNKSHFTIYQLYLQAQLLLAASRNPRDLIDYLKGFPSLGPSLQVPGPPPREHREEIEYH